MDPMTPGSERPRGEREDDAAREITGTTAKADNLGKVPMAARRHDDAGTSLHSHAKENQHPP